jgi:hypothetical protein
VQGNGDDGDAALDQTLTSLQTDLSGPVAHALVVMSFVGSGVFYATSGGRSAGVSRLSLFAGGAVNAVLARARGRARHGTLFMSFRTALALSRSGGGSWQQRENQCERREFSTAPNVPPGFDGVREPGGHIGATRFFTPMR